MNIEDLQNSVQRFRSAIEQIHAQLGPTFENFPLGCCGDVSELLAAYLKDEGFGNFAYVCGWSLEMEKSHAWLEGSGFIIDITADQFQSGVDRKMVSTDKNWHSQFAHCLQRRPDGDFRSVQGAEHLRPPFAILMQHLDCTV